MLFYIGTHVQRHVPLYCAYLHCLLEDLYVDKLAEDAPVPVSKYQLQSSLLASKSQLQTDPRLEGEAQ